jgi:hypothetical protein
MSHLEAEEIHLHGPLSSVLCCELTVCSNCVLAHCVCVCVCVLAHTVCEFTVCAHYVYAHCVCLLCVSSLCVCIVCEFTVCAVFMFIVCVFTVCACAHRGCHGYSVHSGE